MLLQPGNQRRMCMAEPFGEARRAEGSRQTGIKRVGFKQNVASSWVLSAFSGQSPLK
jgi:hypothetical protein